MSILFFSFHWFSKLPGRTVRLCRCIDALKLLLIPCYVMSTVNLFILAAIHSPVLLMECQLAVIHFLISLACLVSLNACVKFLRQFIFAKISVSQKLLAKLNEPHHVQNLFLPYANNKDADQPAHLCSLISIFVIHCLASIISLVSLSEISSL